jgi:hypothetical protein
MGLAGFDSFYVLVYYHGLHRNTTGIFAATVDPAIAANIRVRWDRPVKPGDDGGGSRAMTVEVSER